MTWHGMGLFPHQHALSVSSPHNLLWGETVVLAGTSTFTDPLPTTTPPTVKSTTNASSSAPSTLFPPPFPPPPTPSVVEAVEEVDMKDLVEEVVEVKRERVVMRSKGWAWPLRGGRERGGCEWGRKGGPQRRGVKRKGRNWLLTYDYLVELLVRLLAKLTWFK